MTNPLVQAAPLFDLALQESLARLDAAAKAYEEAFAAQLAASPEDHAAAKAKADAAWAAWMAAARA